MGKKISVLAVDDDPNMLEGLSEVLELEGFEVRTAPSASAALQSAAANAPDLVLSDYQLPDASGLELCAQLAQARPGTPLLMVTGRSLSPQEKEAGRASGVREYVTKPFNMPELVALLRALVPGRDK